MRISKLSAALLAGALATSTSLAALAQSEPTISEPEALEISNGFDHIGAEIHEIDHEGRQIFYIDEGDAEGRAVVFLGGQGTSLAAFQLAEFNRSFREQLGLRMISVERNGFGESPFDPDLGYADYNAEILAVLDHLGVEDFAIVAISGGGAYAAQLAAAVPERVISLHLAAAVSRTLPTRSEPTNCELSLDEMADELEKFTHNPKDWWGVPGSPVLIIPGWQAQAYADATRSFYVNGQLGDATALAAEYLRPCSDDAVVDAERITAPAYLYWGEEDKAVSVKEMEQWQEALPNVVRATVYAGQGHTVQYRHWDQVLTDIAGLGDHIVICRDDRTMLVKAEEVENDEFLGNCAWKAAE